MTWDLCTFNSILYFSVKASPFAQPSLDCTYEAGCASNEVKVSETGGAGQSDRARHGATQGAGNVGLHASAARLGEYKEALSLTLLVLFISCVHVCVSCTAEYQHFCPKHLFCFPPSPRSLCRMLSAPDWCGCTPQRIYLDATSCLVSPVENKASAPSQWGPAHPFQGVGNLPGAPSSALVLPNHQHVAADGEQADDKSEDEIRGDCAAVRHGKDGYLDFCSRNENEKKKIEIERRRCVIRQSNFNGWMVTLEVTLCVLEGE